MSDPQLFDSAAYECAPSPDATMGHDAQRTARRRALLAQGIHPITKRPVKPELGTCGDCAHFIVKTGYAKPYFKCALALNRMAEGPDVRRSYPACAEHEPTAGGAA